MKYYSFLILTIITISCRTISFEELRPANDNEYLLPPLVVMVDTISFETFYWNDPSAHGYEQPNNFPLYQNRYIRDVRVQDAITLFQRDIKDNITEGRGEIYGFVTCKIITGECRYSTVNAIISLVTLFLPNLAGMPFNHHMTHLEVEMEIYDAKEQLVARFTGDGFSKVPIALWRGYRTSDACRLSNIKALTTALNKIKQNIAQDYPRIYQQLTLTGPIARK